jgi:putative holliday junction resolvase
VRGVGIDYGRKRIGLAISDAAGMLARPWKTIGTATPLDNVAADLVREITRLRDEGETIDVVVLGFPRRLSGEPNEQTPVVEALASRLRALLPDVSVVLQDERLSSREAESLLSRREKDWRKRKPLLDATAAAVILQDFLDSRAAPIVPDAASDC